MRRAFVVGNGPSLANTNLDLIADEVTIGVNQCDLIYPQTRWRPTHWICTDRDLKIEKPFWGEIFLKHYQLGERCYVAPRHQVEFQKLRDLHGYQPGRMPPEWDCRERPMSTSRFQFLDMCKEHGTRIGHLEWWPKSWHLPQLCKFAGSVHTAIQFAVQTLGADEIYVVGCDTDYRAGTGNHFTEEYFNFRPYDAEWAEYLEGAQRYGHELAYRECTERGIKIMNAGVGGKLEAYPRCELSSLVTAPA